jgi:hypothetical protein
MDFITDNRGVSEVIGAILVFGLLITLLAVFQTVAVPAANEEVEFNHNQQVQGDMVQFHEAASRVGNDGTDRSVSVASGTQYPTRLLFFNPQNPTGIIETSEQKNVTFTNVSATDSSVRDYLNGSVTVKSRTLSYTPSYNEYSESPSTIYENGVLYNDFGDEQILKNSGNIIDGTRLNLRFIGGEYSEQSSQDVSLELQPNSAPSRAVQITGRNGTNINISLPTESPETLRETLLGKPNVVDVRQTDSNVTMELRGNETYTLRMSKTAVGNATEPTPHYITPAGSGFSAISTGGQATVEFEVRDKYNNPVSGANVTIGSETYRTDNDGIVRITRSPTSSSSITGILDDCPVGATDQCQANYRINVVSAGGASFNPNEPALLTGSSVSDNVIRAVGDALLGSVIDFGSPSSDVANMTFDAKGDDVTVESFRVAHYQASSDNSPPVEGGLADPEANVSESFVVAGDFTEVSSGFNLDSSDETLQVAFTDGEGNVRSVEQGDFFIITFVFEEEGQATYFVSPRAS